MSACGRVKSAVCHKQRLTIVLDLICSVVKSQGIFATCWSSKANIVYDGAHLLKLVVSGQKVQVQQGTVKMTQHTPFSELYSVNSGSLRMNIEKEEVMHYF